MRDMNGGREERELADGATILQNLCLHINIEPGDDPQEGPSGTAGNYRSPETDQPFYPLTDVEVADEKWNEIQGQRRAGAFFTDDIIRHIQSSDIL